MNFKQKIQDAKDGNLFRERLTRTSKGGRYVSIEGKQYLNFNSNDYLGLSTHPAVILAAHEAAAKLGYGSTGSPLMSGYTALHQELEYAMADFLGCQRVALFSSGYLANLGVAQALLKRKAGFLQDRLNHASLMDAAKLTDAELFRHRHLDMDNAEQLLQKYAFTLWALEGVYSMNGDSPDLNRATGLARREGCLLWVDDAHGVGVLGESGRGVLDTQHLGFEQLDLMTGTFGKAFGTTGAYVAGSDELIEWVIQQARTYKFNTALPTPVVAATLKSLELIKTEPWRREKMLMLIEHYQQACEQYGLSEQARFSESPIQPLVLGSESAALEQAQYLRDCGIVATAIRPPTVPKNACRLRLTISSELETEDIDLLVQCLIRNY